VSISECNVRSRSKSSNSRAAIEYKNVQIHTGSKKSSDIESHVLFYGLFLQLELSNITISSPLKIIPARRTHIEDKFGIKITSQSYITDLKVLNSDDRIDLPSSSDAYNVYCTNKEEAKAILTPKFIKVIDFIYSKFEKIEVIMSINKGMFYMAISWNKDIFETDLFLKNNIIESGLANKFHQDIIFINQVITEVGLINKTGT